MTPVGRPRGSIVPRPSVDPWNAVARRFGDALRVADPVEAEAVALQAHASGLPLASVHARVVAPALYRIGELWERGAITVADEHAATAIADRVLAALRARVRPADPERVAATVLLAAPEGEAHVVGLRMLADVLECAGARVAYLGADVPADALASAVGRFEPDVVGLSLTMGLGTRRVEASIAAVAAARPEARVLVGGQGIPQRLVTGGVPYVAGVEDVVAEVAWLTGSVAGSVEAPVDQPFDSPSPQRWTAAAPSNRMSATGSASATSASSTTSAAISRSCTRRSSGKLRLCSTRASHRTCSSKRTSPRCAAYAQARR